MIETVNVTQDRGKGNPHDDGERRLQNDSCAAARSTSQDQSSTTQETGMLGATVTKILDAVVYSTYQVNKKSSEPGEIFICTCFVLMKG